MPFPLMMALFLGASLMQSLAYGLTFLLPDLFRNLGGTVGDVGDTLLVVGVVTVVTAITLGKLTSAFSQLPVLVASCVACAIGLTLLGKVQQMGLLVYAAGAILGFGWAVFYILGPIILAHVLPPEHRVRYFSWLAAFIMAGIGGGPLLGYFIQSLGLDLSVAFLIAGLCSLGSAIAFLLLKTALQNQSQSNEVAETQLTFGSTFQILRSKAWRPVAMVTLGACVFAAAMNFQTIYAQENELVYPVFFAVYTITVIVGRFIVAAWLLHIPPYLTIAAFLTSMTVGVLTLIPPDPSMARYVVSAFLLGVGYGLAYPIVKSMAANDAAPGLQDATLQLFGLGYFVGIFWFPYLGAALLETYGMSVLLCLAAGLAALETALAITRYIKDRAVTDWSGHTNKRSVIK